MNNQEDVASMREACKLMGWQLFSSDHFCISAIECLQHPVVISGNNEEGWSVNSGNCCAGGYTLSEALAGAVLAIKDTST